MSGGEEWPVTLPFSFVAVRSLSYDAGFRPEYILKGTGRCSPAARLTCTVRAYLAADSTVSLRPLHNQHETSTILSPFLRDHRHGPMGR